MSVSADGTAGRENHPKTADNWPIGGDCPDGGRDGIRLPSGTAVANTPQAIERYIMLSQRSALKLEGKGLRFRKSILAHVKRTYGLKGNRETVIAALSALIEGKV